MSVDFPIYRPRRTRATENLRAMIRETEVSVKDLIYPIFVVPGTNVKHEIESLPIIGPLTALASAWTRLLASAFLPCCFSACPPIRTQWAAALGI